MTLDDFLDALLSLPRPIGERASPDGKWIAWSFLGTSAGAEVYVAPSDGAAAPAR